MSDPQPAHLKKKPPQAEPLRPDAPAQGGGTAEDVDGDDRTDADDELREQQATARKNTSEGYK